MIIDWLTMAADTELVSRIAPQRQNTKALSRGLAPIAQGAVLTVAAPSFWHTNDGDPGCSHATDLLKTAPGPRMPHPTTTSPTETKARNEPKENLRIARLRLA